MLSIRFATAACRWIVGANIGVCIGDMSYDAHSEAVERAVNAVNREDFLPAAQVPHAAEDRPLPIGYEQTISQPSLVARMTDELQLAAASRVLEIGTGSGYQTAILAEVARQVFTIERIPELAKAARDRLTRLGYRNVLFRTGDGAAGWPEDAPFDAILVAAAPPAIPPALIEQLAPGGRMVLPVGAHVSAQELVLVLKDRAGGVNVRTLFGVRFVPLISERHDRR